MRTFRRSRAGICRVVLALAGAAAIGVLGMACKDKGPAGAAAAKPSVAWDSESGRVVMASGRLELVVETKPGLNARSLRDTKTGLAYAEGDYAWPGGGFPAMLGVPVVNRDPDGSVSVAFKGKLGPLEVEENFAASPADPGVIAERITIRNAFAGDGDGAQAAADFRCGFTKRLRSGETWSPDADGIRFCPVPYRRETNGKTQEFPLREVAEHGVTFTGWAEEPTPTPAWGAEGWVWSAAGGSFLLAKFNPESMEWSLMEPLARGPETLLRFGGAGRWKHGHPEGPAWLESGASYSYGETRLQMIDGDWKQAYYAYRRFTEGKGCITPATYDPPVHWNELYDNEYYDRTCAMAEDFFGPSKPGFSPEYYKKDKKLQNEYYTLELMNGEAAKAKELGCQALYLDPGWDIGSNQQIWDAARLGSMESFVKMRKDEGLKVSLWCSLAGVPPTIGDPAACPPEARVIGKDGQPVPLLVCCASPAFLNTKEKRLLELCRSGASFLMFDSTQYTGPCYDPSHGHRVPSTREEHARALLELIRRVHAQYPNVLIELHDPISGPSGIHYTPTYCGYARPHSFDCLWGHEFMWNSMRDLLSRQALSLYYYNLAYSIPLYLHVNLKQENEHALVFWWYASNCRHLGMGGKPGPAAWEAVKQAMRTYLPLKRFYVQGDFYGIEEMVHAHTLADLRESVLNAFNLEETPVQKTIRFRPQDIGLPDGSVDVQGAAFRQEGEDVVVELEIPAQGHRLLTIKVGE